MMINVFIRDGIFQKVDKVFCENGFFEGERDLDMVCQVFVKGDVSRMWVQGRQRGQGQFSRLVELWVEFGFRGLWGRGVRVFDGGLILLYRGRFEKIVFVIYQFYSQGFFCGCYYGYKSFSEVYVVEFVGEKGSGLQGFYRDFRLWFLFQIRQVGGIKVFVGDLGLGGGCVIDSF